MQNMLMRPPMMGQSQGPNQPQQHQLQNNQMHGIDQHQQHFSNNDQQLTNNNNQDQQQMFNQNYNGQQTAPTQFQNSFPPQITNQFNSMSLNQPPSTKIGQPQFQNNNPLMQPLNNSQLNQNSFQQPPQPLTNTINQKNSNPSPLGFNGTNMPNINSYQPPSANPFQPPPNNGLIRPTSTPGSFNPLQPPTPGPGSFNPSQPPAPGPGSFNPSQPPIPGPGSFNPIQPPTSGPGSFNPLQPPAPGPGSFNPLQPPAPGPGSFNPSQPPIPGPGSFNPLQPPTSGPGSFNPLQPPSNGMRPQFNSINNSSLQPQQPRFPSQNQSSFPPMGLQSGGIPPPSFPPMGTNQGSNAPPMGSQPNAGPQQPLNAAYNYNGLNHPSQTQQSMGNLNQQQPGVQQAPQSRIDPDAIPNPIDVMNANSSKTAGLFKSNEAGVVPPLVTTDFICKDEGLSNPRFIRSTIYSIPSNQDLIKQSKIPIALSITPFARLRTEPHPCGDVEMEPPISNLGESGPLRCKRCKAYMSPYMQFIDNGRRFQCPYCDDITQVPQEYFNHLDHMGKRVDMYERPELCLGSYEFIATKDYCRNQQLPNPPAFIFMIDVSINSVRNGLLKTLCSHIKDEILPNLPKDVVAGPEDASQIRVGFITYDKEVHFYNLKHTLAAPQTMVVSDIDEIFVPILDGFLVNPTESQTVIHSLLDQLPTMFHENKEADLLLGPVIEAGIEALVSAKCSGKLFIFHTGLPSAHAPGQLKSTRDDRKLLGTDKEKQILMPVNDYYANLGKKCVEAGCSINLFLTPNQYCDLATISDCLHKCSGQIFKYDFFMSDTQGERLIEDLKHCIANTFAFDAVMKVRTSTGMRAVDYLGNFSQSVNDIELAACDRTLSLMAELKHEDKLNENSKVFTQVAVLYTSLSGQRRIRIHNMNFSVSQTYGNMYPNCDLDTIINYIAKLAIRSVGQSTPKTIQENIIQQVANILACYRKNCANAPSRGQFILPETLKLMPLFINSLLKSDAVNGAKNVTTDDRVFHMFRLLSMDVASSYVYFYPRIIPLLDVEDVNNLTQIRCSYERLNEENLYLLENGLVMYLWIGSNVPATVLQNLFGTSQLQQINIEKSQLAEIDTPISQTVRSVIKKVNDERNSMLKLIFVRQKDTLEQFFRPYLVEDKNLQNGASSYVDFLFQLHHEIRSILS